VSRQRQLELLRELQTLTPRPVLLGGFAEDALLHGGFSRDHGDVDLVVERHGLAGLLDHLRAFGYGDWETKGETARGEPFYLAQSAGGVLIELAVTDRDDRGAVFAEIGRVHFTLQTGSAPVGYRVYLPADAFEYPPVTFEGVAVRCLSPLASYQFRVGIGSRGTFGPLRPQDHENARRLRASFFPDATEEDLLPLVEDL
jgi:hypothetical protein